MAAGAGLLDQVLVDERTAVGNLVERLRLHADVAEELAAEVTPAVVERGSQLARVALRKGRPQVGEGEVIAPAEDAPCQRADAVEPSLRPLIGSRTYLRSHSAVS